MTQYGIYKIHLKDLRTSKSQETQLDIHLYLVNHINLLGAVEMIDI